MQTLLKILQYAKPWNRELISYFFLASFAALFSVINLSLIIPLIQLLFEGSSGAVKSLATDTGTINKLIDEFTVWFKAIIQEEGQGQALIYLCFLIVGATLLANILRYSSQLILAAVRVRITQRFRADAFEQLLRKPISFFTDHPKGDIISRLTSDIQDVEQSAVSTLKVLIKEPLLIIAYLIALLYISPFLTLISLILVPVAGLLVSLISKRIKKWSRKSQESMGQLSAIIEEAISGAKLIKLFSAASFFQSRFNSRLQHYKSETFEIASKTNLASPISEVVGAVVLSILLIVGGQQVIVSTQIEPSAFIGFLVIFSQLLVPAKSMAVSISQIHKGIASAERVFHLMEDDNQISSPIDQISRIHSCDIEFKDVSFSYGDKEVVKDFSLKISNGQVVAIVGPSGSGKTTLANLLCRFYDPDSGEILLDNKQISTFEKSAWRQYVGFVPQEPILFNDTITNNICFGAEVDIEKLEAATRITNADTFVQKLPQGYDTVIGEQGNRLSGGEKQRICMARAIYRDPVFLIMDEATASLDAKSEEHIQSAINNMLEGRTVLMIAHRLSSIQYADLIVVIDKGRIIEKGTHDELINQNGLYREMTELQSF